MTRPDYSDARTRAETHACLDAILTGYLEHGSASAGTAAYLRVDAEYPWSEFDVAPTRVQP